MRRGRSWPGMKAQGCLALTERSSGVVWGARPAPDGPAGGDHGEGDEQHRTVAPPEVRRTAVAPVDRGVEHLLAAELAALADFAVAVDDGGVAGRRGLDDVPSGFQCPEPGRGHFLGRDLAGLEG